MTEFDPDQHEVWVSERFKREAARRVQHETFEAAMVLVDEGKCTREQAFIALGGMACFATAEEATV